MNVLKTVLIVAAIIGVVLGLVLLRLSLSGG